MARNEGPNEGVPAEGGSFREVEARCRSISRVCGRRDEAGVCAGARKLGPRLAKAGPMAAEIEGSRREGNLPRVAGTL